MFDDVISDPPSPPEDLHVLNYDSDYVTVAWKPPKSNGGSDITQYVIEKKDVSRASGIWTWAGSVDLEKSSFKVNKLVVGSEYLVRVFAENRVGMSEACELKTPVTARLPYGTSTLLVT